MRPSLVLTLATLACCSAASAAPPDSGVRGTVTIGPTCPVQRVGDPSCDDRPYDARIRVVDRRAHRVVRTVRSGADGRFTIALRAGRYLLRPLSPGRASLPYARPVRVSVPRHRYVAVHIAYDSGIR